MQRLLKIFLLLVIAVPVSLKAQIALSQVFAVRPFLPNSAILPVNKSSITFTQIMFDHPQVLKADRYLISVFEVSGKDTVLFRQVSDSTTATYIDGFSFGKTYSWSYVAYGRKKKIVFKSPTYTFSISPLPFSVKRRINVVVNDLGNMGGLISFDYAEIITNRKGEIVWFLPRAPKNEWIYDDQVRDLRLTSAGTCLFLTERNAFEISIDGRIFWAGHDHTNLKKNDIENFHHAIDRLPNGNIMVCGNHTELLQRDGDTTHYRALFGVIGEYNKAGTLLWKWDSYNYFDKRDVFFKRDQDGRPDVSTHLNAFEISPDQKFIYAGFRDMNRIVKIDRATGVVIESYGDLMPSGQASTGNDFFWKQHDVTLLRNGNLAVFNNDSMADPAKTSSVVVFSQTTATERGSEILWTLNCKIDSLSDGRSEKGGSIDELENGNYLINFGSSHRCIEITPTKKIVWSVVEESQDTSGKWTPFRQYRSHYSSSLYPCYFSLQLISNKSSQVSFVINNEGTESDQYQIEFRQNKGTWIKSSSSPVVSPNGKTMVQLLRTSANQFVDIRVTSTANVEFNRIIEVPLK
jgi:hypothetical protein